MSRLVSASSLLDRMRRRANTFPRLPRKALEPVLRRLTDFRNDSVLLLMSEEELMAYCAKTYNDHVSFTPSLPSALTALWPWEEEALQKFFPPAPASIFIGGAGGGREAFVLASRGYNVVASDLSPRLSAAASEHAASQERVRYYCAAYEDLPLLRGAVPGAPDADIDNLGPFDAAIFGWVSYAHVLSRARRVAALRAVARATRGPVLISTFPRITYGGKPIRPQLIRKLLPFGMARDPGNAFRPGPGFHHLFEEQEFVAELRDAGLKVLHLHWPQTWNDRTDCPWAVVTA